MYCWRLHIKGKVQGVWYRKFTLDKATELGIRGWVRNEKDGSVTAFVQHEDEKVLEELVFACGKGPEAARVDHIEITHTDPESFDDFQIKR